MSYRNKASPWHLNQTLPSKTENANVQSILNTGSILLYVPEILFGTVANTECINSENSWGTVTYSKNNEVIILIILLGNSSTRLQNLTPHQASIDPKQQAVD